jgi:hypothetical protein
MGWVSIILETGVTGVVVARYNGRCQFQNILEINVQSSMQVDGRVDFYVL